MPADHKVSVAWQIVATFVPIANFWAFYRIRKLRKYLLYVVLPTIIVWLYYLSETGLWLGVPTMPSNLTGMFVFNDPILQTKIITTMILWGLQGFSIYLVIIWSRQNNQKFDSPT